MTYKSGRHNLCTRGTELILKPISSPNASQSDTINLRLELAPFVSNSLVQPYLKKPYLFIPINNVGTALSIAINNQCRYQVYTSRVRPFPASTYGKPFFFTLSQACLTRETGASGPRFSKKSQQPFRERRPTPLAICSGYHFQKLSTHSSFLKSVSDAMFSKDRPHFRMKRRFTAGNIFSTFFSESDVKIRTMPLEK